MISSIQVCIDLKLRKESCNIKEAEFQFLLREYSVTWTLQVGSTIDLNIITVQREATVPPNKKRLKTLKRLKP
jgi:hypothetical protein